MVYIWRSTIKADAQTYPTYGLRKGLRSVLRTDVARVLGGCKLLVIPRAGAAEGHLGYHRDEEQLGVDDVLRPERSRVAIASIASAIAGRRRQHRRHAATDLLRRDAWRFYMAFGRVPESYLHLLRPRPLVHGSRRALCAPGGVRLQRGALRCCGADSLGLLMAPKRRRRIGALVGAQALLLLANVCVPAHLHPCIAQSLPGHVWAVC